MSLNDRKIKILQAIINDYIVTAEPIGSRTIAKKYDFGLSSATIRNEMSDLEEMGFIIQPHTSAGRIPSDLGYRLYVDGLIEKPRLEESERNFLKSMATENINQIELLMEETARILSTMTNYTTIISEPVAKTKKVKKIQLMSLDDKTVSIAVASEKNVVKSYTKKVEYLPDDDELHSISCIISEVLSGKLMSEISIDEIEELDAKLPGQSELIAAVVKVIGRVAKENEQLQLHLSGTKNILAFPEFSDVKKAKTLMQTLEEKEVLQNLLSGGKDNGSDIQIYIGAETGIEEMKDCSVITTSYKFDDGIEGSIAILGPTRMNYEQVISTLNGIAKNIEETVAKLRDEDAKNDS